MPTLARRGALSIALSCAGAGLLGGCRTAEVVRINPGVEPERFRVTCGESFHPCRREAKQHCDGEFVVIEQHSNGPEPKPVPITGVSSTGPSEGAVGWRGEMVFQCGKLVKPVRLVRPDAPVTAGSEAASTVAPLPVAGPSVERVCVPGVTQACLGPGACSGAQACLADGAGYGACDCGAPPAPATTAAPSGAAGAPASPPDPAGSLQPPRPETSAAVPATPPSSGAAQHPKLPPSR